MPFSGLIAKDGSFKNSLFKDKDPSTIPQGYCVIKQQYFSITHSDLEIKDGAIGMEGAGVIESVPNESERGFEKGDKVCYYIKKPMTSYENVIVHESALIKVPQGVELDVAAQARKILTAHYLLYKILTLKKGTWIIVTGAGGSMGTILTAWANYAGLNIIAIISDDDKKQYVLQNGAKVAINYKKQNVEEEVMRATNSVGAFAVYDVIGKDFYPTAMKSLSYFGHYILIGKGLSGLPVINFAAMQEKSSTVCYPNIEHYKNLAFENLVGGAEFLEFVLQTRFTPTIQKFTISNFSQATQSLLDRTRTGLIACSFR